MPLCFAAEFPAWVLEPCLIRRIDFIRFAKLQNESCWVKVPGDREWFLQLMIMLRVRVSKHTELI